MSGLSVEETLSFWASSLRAVKAWMRPLFTQERVARSAGRFLDGLLGHERRRTGWMRAEAAGDPGPWRQRAILGRGRWDADALRDIIRDYVLEHIADDDAVLVIDETGFLKQGKASCGVAGQYTGSAGKITNRQIGVFAAYLSRHGHALIDRALYLPKAWTDDPARLAATHVPDGTGLATKPAIAGRMIERAIQADVPFRWVAADTVYGVSTIETALRRAGKGYVLGVLGVKGTHLFQSWDRPEPVSGTAKDIAEGLPNTAWHRLSAGEGTKGARLYDWAYLDLADLDAAEYDETRSGLWTRGLLVRRTITDGDLAFFSTWCPKGTDITTLVRVEGHRRAIEDSFETTKNELGLDHNETRSWLENPILAGLAPPCLPGHARLCHAGRDPPSCQRRLAPKKQPAQSIRWSVQEIRRLATKLAQRQIHPAHITAWSIWRRAHQAAAQKSHLKRNM